jgi:hypothetical protein
MLISYIRNKIPNVVKYVQHVYKSGHTHVRRKYACNKYLQFLTHIFVHIYA